VSFSGKQACRSYAVAAPARGPEADFNVGIKRTVGGLAVVINTVVEGHRRHSGFLDNGRCAVHILDVVVIQTGGLNRAKAGGRNIVRVLVGAEVEMGAAFSCKVSDVLLQHRERKRSGGFVRHVDGALGSGVGQLFSD